MKLKLKISAILIVALGMIWATGANALLTVLNGNVPAGFSQLGTIQQATLDNPADPNSGGTLTINGIRMIVPRNSIIQMPANTLTWAQLFDAAVSAAIYDNSIPAQATPPINHPTGMTGLALADAPPVFPPAPGAFPGPFTTFNAAVEGNIDIKNERGFGSGAYIVAVILPIDQDVGNGGAGFITFIDYAAGRFEVGGTLNVQHTGTVVEINDPSGRFGLAHSPDPRWSVDPDNPTVMAKNGYPMGLPKTAPGINDPDRPYTNRPLNPAIGAPGHDPFLQPGAPLLAFNAPDPTKQVPFMVGDYVVFAGILVKFNPSAAIDPLLPMNQQMYISANTVNCENIEVSTPNRNGPAYVMLERMVVGTGGTSITVPNQTATLGIQGGVIPIAEPKRNIVITGFCTDSSQLVDIYAIDISRTNGNETRRLLGTVLPQPGFANGKGNKGRFIFEVGKGAFTPVTRMYTARTRHGQTQLGDQLGLNGAHLPGLLTGQYRAPMFTFQVADPPPGYPIAPSNFQDFPFLFSGEGGNLAPGPLTPFPPFLP
jgi:hypothetical protein